MATRLVSDDQQGRFQGVLQSAISLSAVIAPLFFSNLYYVFRPQWPGAIWLSVVALQALAIPLILGLKAPKASAVAG